MGLASSVFRRLFNKQESRILMLGLDAAGKTTILYKLKLGEVTTDIPTIGFNVEKVTYEGVGKVVSFTAWDVGGRDKIRSLWRHYYKDTNALVYVVDSNDRDRTDEAADEIAKALSEDLLRNVPLLVFANKQDVPNAMTVAEVTDKLRLHAIRNRQWFIQASCATTGDGLYEGLDWLSATLGKGTPKAGVSKTVVKGNDQDLQGKTEQAKLTGADDSDTCSVASNAPELSDLDAESVVLDRAD